ncbi:MAG: MutS-related protein, partial [Terriglobia bacterium]
RIAAEALIRSLVEGQGIGLITSHDLALSEIGEMDSLRGAHVHFTDSPASAGLSFDYRIHPGKLIQGNTLKTIKLVGLA